MGLISNDLTERPDAFGKIKGQVSYAEYCVIYCMFFIHEFSRQDVFNLLDLDYRTIDVIYTEIMAGRKAKSEVRRLALLRDDRKELITKELGSLQ